MKQLSLNRLLIMLRVLILLLVTIFISHVLLSFTIKKYTDGFWAELGINQQEGTENIKTSFLNNYFQYYGARKAKHIAVGNRAAIAKDLLDYSKKYINSAAFKAEYEKLRSGAMPEAPGTTVPRSKGEIRKEKIEETEAALKKMEAGLKDMTPDMQKIMEPTLELYRQQVKDYKDPGNQMIDLFVSAEKMSIEQRQREYETDYKQWQENYPESVKHVIRKRLEYYLTLSSTVDFNAALIEKNRKMTFVKSGYEAKPADWKMIFRAGKAVYDVARPFAEQWLTELK